MTTSLLSASKKLELFDLGKNRFVSYGTLERLLPTMEVALFFAKTYDLSGVKLGDLLKTLFNSSVVQALTEGSHSTELQDYIDTLDIPVDVRVGTRFDNSTPPAEFLPELWEASQTTIAKSIREVAEKLGDILDKLPGKQGYMTFEHMHKVNKLRPIVGVYGATIKHKQHLKNLVILDVSGSMSENTIRTIANDVVALAIKANAALAIVSNSSIMWEPGTFTTSDVLKEAQYGGTRYETLASILTQPWDTVITIADYDSSQAAKKRLGESDMATIEQVFDISLVASQTFLAECVGQNAKRVESLLQADRNLC